MKKMYADITDFVFVESTVEKADILFIPGSDHPPLMEKAAALYHGGLHHISLFLVDIKRV